MKKILKINVVALAMLLLFLSVPINSHAAGIGKTFAEQFPNPTTAQVMAAHFGKSVDDEIDTTIAGAAYLNLKTAGLTDITGFGLFTELQNLYLDHNDITTIPDDFASLTKLEVLSFDYNKIDTLPAFVFNNTQLRELSFYNNKLSAIPNEIGNLTKLVELDLGTNMYLTDLPDGFANLKSLTKLFLNGNSFSDEFTWMEKVGQLNQLVYLDLGVNNIETFPATFQNLTNLNHLDFRTNPLAALPDNIGNLTQLKYFYLDENQLTSLPSSILNLPNLFILEVNKNLLATDYTERLLSLGLPVPGSVSYPQNQLMLKNQTSLIIKSQADLDDMDYFSFLKLKTGYHALSTNQQFRLENYVDDQSNTVQITDYIENGIVKKESAVYAQVRATGTGIFPNDSDHAITAEKIQLNFEITKYNLSFDLNGVIGRTGPADQDLIEGAKATAVEDPTREGYTFKGWNTKADGTGAKWNFETSTMPAGPVILYAQWEINTYAVHFDENGGTGTMADEPFTYGETKKLDKETYTREGYTFLGWSTMPTGDIVYSDEADYTLEIFDNVTLYAQWEKQADPVPVVNPVNPVDPVTPVAVDSGGIKTPATGDSTSIIGLIILALGASSLLGNLYNRKKL